MTSGLLQTKLFPPSARPGWMPRERLFARLEEARRAGAPLILCSAPAGFGKSTLAAQWLARTGEPVAWVSLDERDNQPPRFYRYLLTALQQACPSVRFAAAALLDLPRVDPEEWAAALLADLAGAGEPLWIALDDFHTIQDSGLIQMIQTLAEAQQPGLRLLLLTRRDPPLRLGRLRARGQLVEIRSNDLRFTAGEAERFFQQTMRLTLGAEQVRALEARTEGWAAGLQLAALALRPALEAGEEPGRFIAAFSGSHRFVLDYLMEEVLARQSPEVMRFLLHTAILDRFCASLCAPMFDGAYDEARCQAFIERLEQENLFVVALDDERRWYRYHHLFADLLRARLKAEDDARMRALFGRARGWFEERGDPTTALQYALEGQDYESAVALLLQHSEERWRMTDSDFLNSIQRLPRELLVRHPGLGLEKAWMDLVAGKLGQVEPMIAAVEAHWRDRPVERLSVEERGRMAFAEAIRAYLADFSPQPPETRTDFREAMAFFPESNVAMYNSGLVVFGTLLFTRGAFAEAEEYFHEAIQRDLRAGGTNAIGIATARLARIYAARGRPRELRQLCEQNERYAREHDARRFYLGGSPSVHLAEALIELDDLDAAEAYLKAGLRLHERWLIPHAYLIALSIAARLYLAKGDLAETRAAVERGERLRAEFQVHPDAIHLFDAERVTWWARTGQTAALAEWARETEAWLPPERTFRNEMARIALARAWLAVGRAAEARVLLAELAEQTRAAGRDGHLLQILLLSGPEARAEALRLAEKNGYARVLAAEAPLAARAPATGGLVEPLSERELEVLRLAAGGLTNQEIADRLVISVRTVKKHIENIHGKLGVANRGSAVARARGLGLL